MLGMSVIPYLGENRVHGLNDVVTVLLCHHHGRLVLDDVAMDTVSKDDDLVVNQHSD